MKRPLSFSLLFLAFSAGVLRSQSDALSRNGGTANAAPAIGSALVRHSKIAASTSQVNGSAPSTPWRRAVWTNAGRSTSRCTLISKSTSPSSRAGPRWFSFFNFAPAYSNAMPFYFHTGLIYKGRLIPGRDQAQTGVAFALGNYSYDKILADYNAGRTVHQTYEGVPEFDYRIQVNKWPFVQPFLQYLIRPNGTGLVQNATVLGLHFGVEF